MSLYKVVLNFIIKPTQYIQRSMIYKNVIEYVLDLSKQIAFDRNNAICTVWSLRFGHWSSISQLKTTTRKDEVGILAIIYTKLNSHLLLLLLFCCYVTKQVKIQWTCPPRYIVVANVFLSKRRCAQVDSFSVKRVEIWQQN